MTYQFWISETPPSLQDWYSGVHWTKRRNTANLWHQLISYNPEVRKLPRFEKPVLIQTDIYFKDKRNRDASNYVSTAHKLIEDGLRAAGKLIDDSTKHIPFMGGGGLYIGSDRQGVMVTIKEV